MIDLGLLWWTATILARVRAAIAAIKEEVLSQSSQRIAERLECHCAAVASAAGPSLERGREEAVRWVQRDVALPANKGHAHASCTVALTAHDSSMGTSIDGENWQLMQAVLLNTCYDLEPTTGSL